MTNKYPYLSWDLCRWCASRSEPKVCTLCTPQKLLFVYKTPECKDCYYYYFRKLKKGVIHIKCRAGVVDFDKYPNENLAPKCADFTVMTPPNFPRLIACKCGGCFLSTGQNEFFETLTCYKCEHEMRISHTERGPNV